MWPQRKRDSARLNFSKTVLECSVETDRPVALAEFDAFKIVRGSGNILAVHKVELSFATWISAAN